MGEHRRSTLTELARKVHLRGSPRWLYLLAVLVVIATAYGLALN